MKHLNMYCMQELDLEDGAVDNPVLQSSPPCARRNRSAQAAEQSAIPSESESESKDIQAEEVRPENKRGRTRGGGYRSSEQSGQDSKLKTPALRGLLQVRGGVVPVVEREKNALKEALHIASLDLQERHRKILVELDRAKFVAHKCVEKTNVLRKAVEEYGWAYDVLQAAQSRAAAGRSTRNNASQNSFVEICETLVNSWAVNVQIAEDRLSGWEFKSKRQATIVSRVRNEFCAAETAANENRTKIHEDLNDLKALKNLLENL